MSQYGALLPSQNTSPNIQRPQGTGYVTRDVDPNSLVSNQLTNLLGSDSPYIQQARNQSSAQAASRGLLNSSMAAGAGQAAAIQAGLPIASQDASTYGQVAQDNMGATNNYLLRSGDWANQLQNTTLSTSASTAIAEANRREQARQFDANYQRDGERYDTDWDREQQRNVMARQNFIGSGLMNTVMSDPSLWRDPEGAMGFMNYYGGNMNSMWNDIFGVGGSTPPPAQP